MTEAHAPDLSVLTKIPVDDIADGDRRTNVAARVNDKKFLADLESVTKEALQGEVL